MARTIELVPRIIHNSYDTPRKLAGVIRFCKRVGIREVQLVPVRTPYEPAWLPRPALAKRRREIARAIRGLGEEGIEGTINILRTFMPIPWPEQEPIGFKQPRMDQNGLTKDLTPCPLDKTYLEYMHFFYQEMARTGATKLLVDDDYRYESLGMGMTCFCPLHLAEFRRRTGHRIKREALAKELAKSEPTKLKRAWMDFKRTLLVELAASLRDAVHEVDPTVRVGLMLTSTEIALPDARDSRELVDTFAGDLRPVVRPGQGWYTDRDRLGLSIGLVETAYQTHLQGPDTEIMAEVDSVPHTAFAKTPDVILGSQLAANLACNLKKQTVWAFDERSPIDENHPYADVLRRSVRLLRAGARWIPDEARLQGVETPYNQWTGLLRSQGRPLGIGGGLAPVHGPMTPVLLWRLGVSYTFDPAPVTLLNRDAFPLSRAEIDDLFETRNLFLGVSALEELNRVGMARKLGLRLGAPLSESERVAVSLGQSAVIGEAAGGSLRAGRLRKALRIRPTGRWRVLAQFLDTRGRATAPAVVAAEKGGRRIVATSIPLDLSRIWATETGQALMHSLLEWLRGGPLAARVVDAPDLAPILLQAPGERTQIVTLLNNSSARYAGCTLAVAARRAANRYRVEYLTDTGTAKRITPRYLSKHKGALHIRLPEDAAVGPYRARMLRIAER